MTTINRLSAVDTLQGGDQIPVYDQSNGDARKASMTVISEFLSNQLITNLTQSTNAIASGDLVSIYDLSANAAFKFDVDLLRNFIRENIFGGMTAGDVLSDADLLAVYDASASAVRSLTADSIADYTQKKYFDMQYASPSATGFSVAITDSSANTHLILTPTAGFATGTIVLPAIANVVDKQEILVNCTQQVVALTVDGNGAGSVTGEPSSLGADDFFRLKYDAITNAWYRVG